MRSIKKASGYQEPFDSKKLRRSLHKAGVPEKLTNEIVQEIEHQKPRSTKKIHELVIDMLQQESAPLAARYNLKRALMELGPSGFPFEQFVAELFRAQGYKAMVDQTISGLCIDHEVDVLAEKKDKHYTIECKFHNRPGLKTNVKVALYIHAQFADIKKAWEQDPNHHHPVHQAWIATNTRFTSKAHQYAQCVGLKLLSWKHPHGASIAELVDKYGLHPITALTYLSRAQKQRFIEHGFVLCRDAQNNRKVLKKMGFSDKKIEKIIREAQAVCQL